MGSSQKKTKILLLQPISIFTSGFDFKNTIITHLLELGTNVNLQFKDNRNVSVEVINLIDEDIYKPNSIEQYDKHIQSIEHFLQKFNDGTQLIFGISCFSTNYYISTIVLAKIIRRLYPKSLICVGGYQVNYFTEEFIFPRYIEGHHCSEKLFDYVFLGESDLKFAKIVKKLVTTNKTDSNKHEKCHIIQCGLVDNLNSLPFIDYSLMKTPESPFIFVPIYFSKGCPFNCTFCGDFRNIYAPKKRWRLISPNGAFSRLKELNKYYENKTFQVQIFDPLWAYPQWRIDFYKLLQEHNITQEIWAEIRVDQYSSKETEYLKKLNFTLAFGLESASPTMLQIMRKSSNPVQFLAQFSDILSELNNAGVYVICNILFGHPGETRSTLLETIEYVEQKQQKVENFIPSVSKYMLIPGSDVFNNQKYYIDKFHAKFYHTHYWTIPKCSAISSSMVDPSDNFGYLDVIKAISQWLPDFYSTCIKKFSNKKERDFIFQRYLNQMVLGPRLYWKDNVLRDYNEYDEENDVVRQTEAFWNDMF